jgi:hypothetical protein
MGAAGESATAIATLLKRKPAGVHQRAHLLEIKLARSLPGPKPRWKADIVPLTVACFEPLFLSTFKDASSSDGLRFAPRAASNVLKHVGTKARLLRLEGRADRKYF